MIRIWALSKENPNIFQSSWISSIKRLAFSPNGDSLITLEERKGTVRLWELPDLNAMIGTTIATAQDDVIYRPDGQRIVTESRDGSIIFFDAFGERVIEPILDGRNWHSMSFHGGNLILFTVGQNGQVWFRLPRVRQYLSIFQTHQNPSLVNLTEDGQFIGVVADDNRTVGVWTSSGQKLSQYEGLTEEITNISMNSRHQLVAISGLDNLVNLWSFSGELS